MANLNISEEITDANMTLVTTKISEIIAVLVFLQVLSKAEIKKLLKMGVKMEGYIVEVDQAVTAFPTAIPAASPYAEFTKDRALYSKLTQLYNLTGSLFQSISDTRMIVGSELITTANVYYNALKSAAKNNIAMDDAMNKVSSAYYKNSLAMPVVNTIAASSNIIINNVRTGTQLINKGQAIINFKPGPTITSKSNAVAIVVDPMSSATIPSGWTHIEVTNLSTTVSATISVRMK